MESSVPTARFEKVDEALGADVFKLLTPPEQNLAALEKIALSSAQSGEGGFVPCCGDRGAGKTTLARTIVFFLPARIRF
jgi:hypothetical protein